jgi:aminomethyltransferase
MVAPLRTVPLHDRHTRLGARFVPFAGWTMPLQYAGIIKEHTAVRQRVGLFDVSHMGRVQINGPDAAAHIRSVTTFDVTTLPVGAAHYSLYCNDDGGIADDVFLYHIDQGRWLIVHNAANAAHGAGRLLSAAPHSTNDISDHTVMLALQGPQAVATLSRLLDTDIAAIPPRTCREVDWQHGRILIGRTGYTGEDGAEAISDIPTGERLWDACLADGVTPAGLGARDTLRLEAALHLHGNDIDPTTHPFDAGLGWVVSLDDEQPFIGRNALTRLKSAPRTRRLVHLRALDRGVPRPGLSVHSETATPDDPGRPLGVLTSGAYSPTLRTGLGMAYLPLAYAKPHTRLTVNIRGRLLPVEVVRRPFYKRPD